MSTTPTAQYHIVAGKKDELVVGPDNADVVITVGRADINLDPSVAFMQGKLKSTGSTGALFTLLKSGDVARTLAEHA
ncbi:MAG: hypothetical protein QOD72_127 [Acidimicrobiaceae bacterium]|nr:hypothetical protein [Acidimicrobiaceae bacterium]